MANKTPSYLRTLTPSELEGRAKRAMARLTNCTLCPRQCKVNRIAGENGYCRTGRRAVVASYNAHFGEESPLVGQNGSGTIFFSHCNLLCNFCQNYDISHQGAGHEVDDHQLASMMLALQKTGCHNINLVSPTHVMPQILSALCIAVNEGLSIPLVYNTSGYESVTALALLDDIIDIYLADFKFWDKEIAEKTCQAKEYPQVAQNALKKMHNQVGDLLISSDGLAYRGLLVRHLVLPGGLAGTSQIMTFLATQISTDTYVNIMPQYRPCGKASKTPPLGRAITDDEFEDALRQAMNAKITRFDYRKSLFI